MSFLSGCSSDISLVLGGLKLKDFFIRLRLAHMSFYPRFIGICDEDLSIIIPADQMEQLPCPLLIDLLKDVIEQQKRA